MKETISYLIKVKNFFYERQCQENEKIDHRLGENFLQKTQLINTVIQRRDKKAFLSDQCKEIEENNRMGKTRDRYLLIQEN